MNDREIEAEVQARVDFKMNELITGLSNRSKFESRLGFDLLAPPKDNMKHMYYAEAFNMFIGMVRKEAQMAPPDVNMHQTNIKHLRDVAVGQIMLKIEETCRGKLSHGDIRSIIHTVVNAVERSQVYVPFELSTGDLYEFNDKQYSLISNAKMSIGELWTDVVIYQTEYDQPDGKYFVRESTQFHKLFKKL